MEEGAGLVCRTTDAFMQISQSALKMDEVLSSVSAVSGDQSRGIVQANQTISDINDITLQNASLAKKSADASGEMNAEAENMQELIQKLALMVGKHIKNKTLGGL